jgi:hypothetical protein
MNHDHGLMVDTKVIPIASDAVVDTAGFEGVVFVAHFDAASGSNKLTLRDGSEAGGGDQAIVKDADGNNAELTMDATATVGRIQNHKPVERYVSCTQVGAGTMTAVLYGTRTQATTPGTTTNEASFVSPE